MSIGHGHKWRGGGVGDGDNHRRILKLGPFHLVSPSLILVYSFESPAAQSKITKISKY